MVVRLLSLFLLVTLLSSCATMQPEEMPISTSAPMVDELKTLRPPERKVPVAVYKFNDVTGQRKTHSNLALLSSAVTQGGDIWLLQALKKAFFNACNNHMSPPCVTALLNKARLLCVFLCPVTSLNLYTATGTLRSGGRRVFSSSTIGAEVDIGISSGCIVAQLESKVTNRNSDNSRTTICIHNR